MPSATCWGEDAYAAFKKLDVGDVIGCQGEVFRPRMGELSVRVTGITLLSKSLQPLPEKFHGLTDREARYRQRYVDLIVNPEVKQAFIMRSRFIKFVRDFLDARGFMEVEDPGAQHHLRRRHGRGRSSPTTTRWTLTCTCALPPSCRSSG